MSDPDHSGGVWIAGICAVIAFVLWMGIVALSQRVEFIEAKLGIEVHSEEDFHRAVKP